MTDQNNCNTCDHKNRPDGGHCYMFRFAPTEPCAQHTTIQQTGTEMTNEKQAIDDGGPAFPGQYDHGGGQIESWVGMTLRDYFAARAMQGLMSSEVNASLQEFANASYRAADAMIEARKGGAK